jgi:multicomponent Na+:H+ antiporter subunit D
LAGLPPVGGFVSKWYLVLGAYEAEAYVFAAIMAFGGLFTAGYLFPIVYRAFFRPAPLLVTDQPGTPRDASPLMVVPLCVTAALGLLLGLGDLFGVYGITSEVAAAVTGAGR